MSGLFKVMFRLSDSAFLSVCNGEMLETTFPKVLILFFVFIFLFAGICANVLITLVIISVDDDNKGKHIAMVCRSETRTRNGKLKYKLYL